MLSFPRFRSLGLKAVSRTQAGCIYAAFAMLWLAPARGESAYAQTSADNAAGSINLGVHGGIAPETAVHAAPAQDRPDGPFELSFRAGFATDYIYRGTTLSAHQPALGAAFEAALSMFYGSGTIASVKLPTQPAAEITIGGGVRPKLGDIQFDFGATYFSYPGETPPVGVPVGINYWETMAHTDTKLGEQVRVAGGFAYSPNVSNTGAWSKYAAVGLGLDLPSNVLPQDVSASLTGGAGYFWFGNQSAELGGFPLPAHLNWNAGVTFTRKSLNLDLRYYDTNLSRENCFVFTGDPSATPGGRPNSITNPDGLVSRWCNATFVAKLWFALN
jgi:uncharacterized protein (TIGR02001 family)